MLYKEFEISGSLSVSGQWWKELFDKFKEEHSSITEIRIENTDWGTGHTALYVKIISDRVIRESKLFDFIVNRWAKMNDEKFFIIDDIGWEEWNGQEGFHVAWLRINKHTKDYVFHKKSDEEIAYIKLTQFA